MWDRRTLGRVKPGDAWKALVAHSAEVVARARAMRDGSRQARTASLRTRLAAQQLRKVSAHDLIPLELAVRAIFRSVYAEQFAPGQSTRQAGHLDALAYTVAAMRPIYAYEGDGSSLRRIYDEELSGCLFRGGGREMYFIDGRCPVHGLAVAAEDVPLVIQALKARLPNG